MIDKMTLEALREYTEFLEEKLYQMQKIVQEQKKQLIAMEVSTDLLLETFDYRNKKSTNKGGN